MADGETTTLEAFIQAYESNEYDLVWVSGHGDFQHLEPHKSSIQLFGDKILQLKDLSALRNSWENRRLLFLNICDGATTSLSNSPVSIGMTHYLVHKKQTLLSHLWPVYPLAAIFLGWIIAASIEKERSYADLFSEAVQTFASGKEAVLALLGRYTVQHDILDRIRNAEFDLSNFYYWGSLTLLQ